jgi:hypothetical protein
MLFDFVFTEGSRDMIEGSKRRKSKMKGSEGVTDGDGNAVPEGCS